MSILLTMLSVAYLFYYVYAVWISIHYILRLARLVFTGPISWQTTCLWLHRSNSILGNCASILIPAQVVPSHIVQLLCHIQYLCFHPCHKHVIGVILPYWYRNISLKCNLNIMCDSVFTYGCTILNLIRAHTWLLWFMVFLDHFIRRSATLYSYQDIIVCHTCLLCFI